MQTKQKTADHGLVGRIVGLTAVFTLFFEVFGGVARYVLANADALFVNNIPSSLSVLLLGAYFLRIGAKQKMEPFMMGVAAWCGIYLLYAVVNGLSFMQSVFGFYIWALFLLGILVCVYEQEEFVFRFLPLAWLCTVIGVIVNYFTVFPWTGMSYVSHGIQVEMGVKWWAVAGVERLAGFSHASYSAASTILFCLAYILASQRYSILTKILYYIASDIALYLTTSKTEIFVLIALPLVMTGYAYLKKTIPNSMISYNWMHASQLSMAALIIILPLVLGSDSLFDIPDVEFFTTNSLIDRIEDTWPAAFSLFSQSGNYLLGRGIGGIGVAQLTDEPFLYTYGDNLFVFIIVTGGLFLTVPLFAGFFRSQKAMFFSNPAYFETLTLMNFCVLGMGLMTGVIEGSFSALLFGFLVARCYITPSFAKIQTT